MKPIAIIAFAVLLAACQTTQEPLRTANEKRATSLAKTAVLTGCSIATAGLCGAGWLIYELAAMEDDKPVGPCGKITVSEVKQ